MAIKYLKRNFRPASQSAEINKLQIPANKVEIEYQELIAYANLLTNDPVPWGLKQIISNIAIGAFRALTDVEAKEHCIQNLQSQLEEIKSKKTLNRSRIPTQGKPWIDREDIEKFFEFQTTEAQEAAKQKYHNATKLIVARKERLAECTRKRKDAERLEVGGKLPKQYKTGVKLLRKEGCLMEQILEAEQRVRKLKKHIEELTGNMNTIGEEQTEEESESSEYCNRARVGITPVSMVLRPL
ncbi:hypothetical protein L873DRAFT_1792395 [Choiromyces venosus 120613-1]|uniref:Uncharacterized protein n=1 Tax=Choiromyces venosus 120613-1 TaxID=1336337 RepID=A0A3N4JMV9_9PEZI|nr:hypothetical protein L873DRAFT_1792395 [Choiromyces venosus 120613-1]